MTAIGNTYSYSGADCKAYGYYNIKDLGIDKNGMHLQAMHTISFSVYDAKASVRSLGFKSVRGHTRAIRTIAGTMIMLVVKDHPLLPLMKANPYHKNFQSYYGNSNRSWSFDGADTALGTQRDIGPNANFFDSLRSQRRVPTTLPPFNLLVECVSEIPSTFVHKTTTIYDTAAVELIDVELLGQGIVLSVNDMVAEVQYQFTARDYRDFSQQQFTHTSSKPFELGEDVRGLIDTIPKGSSWAFDQAPGHETVHLFIESAPNTVFGRSLLDKARVPPNLNGTQSFSYTTMRDPFYYLMGNK